MIGIEETTEREREGREDRGGGRGLSGIIQR